MKDSEKVVVTIKEGKGSNNEGGMTSVDPTVDFNLGEQAYKIERKDVSDTEKKLEGLGMSYYIVRGGEILGKAFNEDRTSVIFNQGQSDEFEISTKGNAIRNFSRPTDTWYSNKKEAYALAKELTAIELDKSNEALTRHQEARDFLTSQLDKNQF